MKYVDVTVDERSAQIAFTVAPGDVTVPLGLPPDTNPSIDKAATAGVAAYVARWLDVFADDAACAREAATAAPDADRKFVVVRWTLACPHVIERATLDFSAFFGVDQRHEAIATIHAPGQPPESTTVRAAEPRVVVRVTEERDFLDGLRGALDPARLALLAALVLLAGVARATQPLQPARLWRGAATGGAFAVAQLAGAVAGVGLPTGLAAAMLAIATVYVSVENVLRPDTRGRPVLAFAFGLVAGAGAQTSTIVAVGTALGTAAFATAVAVIAWLAGRATGDRYRRLVLPTAGLLATTCALAALV